MNFVDKIYLKLGLDRTSRIRNYIKNLEKSIEIKKEEDKKLIFDINELVEEKISKIDKTYFLMYLFYFGLYFSFISFVFSNSLILSELSKLIGKIISFFGTTFFMIGIFITNKIIELNFQDLNLLTAHLISIYSSHTKNIENLFPENKNYYNIFISFFKERGFEKTKSKNNEETTEKEIENL